MNKLQSTLIIGFILLNSIKVNVYAADISTDLARCNDALDQLKYAQALSTAEMLLKQDSKQHGALLCQGRAHIGQQQHELALTSFQRALSSAKVGYETTVTHVLMGNTYKQKQQYAEALSHYQSALSSAQLDSDRKFTLISHHLIGEIYALSQDYSQALVNYEAGAKLALNDNERADSYERIAMTYQSLNQLDKAIEYQLKGTMMQKKSGTLDQYAEASLSLASMFAANKDFKSADKTLERLLAFSKSNGGEYYVAKTLIFMADSKLAQGDSAAATALMQEAKPLAHKLQATDLIALIERSQ